MELSDEFLMHCISNGEEAAFRSLYYRYAKRLFLYVYRMTGKNREQSEDIVQNTFIKVYEQAKSFQSEYSVKTWLYTIANNQVKNEHRKRDSFLKYLSKGTYPINESFQKDTEIDRVLFTQEVESWIQLLDESKQKILFLRFQQEFTIPEIAQTLGIPEGTVKSSLFYLLKQLARQLPHHHPHLSS